MGKVFEQVAFFDRDITLDVHSATHAKWLGKKTVDDIVGSNMATFEKEVEIADGKNGDYVIRVYAPVTRKDLGFAAGTWVNKEA